MSAGNLRREVADALGHGVDVTWGAGDRLCHHATVQIEDAGGQVACLAHRGGERGADHGLGLFLYHGDQPVPHDLAMDLRKRVGFVRHQAFSCVSSM